MGDNRIEKADLSYNDEESYRRYGRKKTVGIFTLGCKVNQYDSEALSELFENQGYQVVDFHDRADIYVINTCTVTGLSARKSRQAIRQAKKRNKDAIVAVVGCYSQTAPEEVREIPGVDLVIGTGDRKKVVEYVRQAEAGKAPLNAVGNIMDAREFEELTIDAYKGHTRAVLKIQEGCSQFCTYCIIPYARGPVRSRKPANVIDEVRKLAQRGFKEIVLTGIHLASYGKDIGNTCLLDIIREIHKVDGIERIRLGSLEPNTFTPEFIEAVAGLGKLCPHYHVSLQSGCDETLARMNRKYTTAEYRQAIQRLRAKVPDVAVTTDVMAGFPGETEEEFEKTCSFVEEIGFARMHVFKYSPRKGTPAAGFPGQVSPEAKEERSERLLRISRRKTWEFHAAYAGRIVSVLFEQPVKGREGFMEGLTPNYIRVVCKGDRRLENRILDVRADEAVEDYLSGTVVQPV